MTTLRVRLSRGGLPPFFLLQGKSKQRAVTPVVHPLGVFGATFVREGQAWPDARPDWAMVYADFAGGTGDGDGV